MKLLARIRQQGSKLLLLGLLLLSLGSAAVSAQTHDDERWVSSWATSPSSIPGTEPALDVADATLRLIVHSSAGGSALRLRLSNYHGDAPVQIGEVAVALQAHDSAIEPGSSTPVSFNGRPSVTIARGATVFSDPISFVVPAARNLSVSLYVLDDGGFLTAHALSNQTNYVSEPGNHVGDTRLPVAQETPAWGLLTAIDVISEDGVSAIATVGDSITDGWDSTLSGNQRWPNHFARRLYNDNSIADFAIVNAGISGNQVTSEDNPLFGQNLQARFERDVLSLSKLSHMVLLEGINDIGMSSRGEHLVSADAVIAGYRQIIARAHARGIKVIGATLTPYEGAAYYTPEGEVVRQRLNQFIRTSGEFDGVIDFERVVQDPAHPKRILPEFTMDNLHPNDMGYKAMAEAIDLNLFR
jgi:lysophospholipase L1-like esterase